jgi:hypothetical protein
VNVAICCPPPFATARTRVACARCCSAPHRDCCILPPSPFSPASTAADQMSVSTSEQKLSWEFMRAIESSARKGRVVLVIDGVDRLESRVFSRMKVCSLFKLLVSVLPMMCAFRRPRRVCACRAALFQLCDARTAQDELSTRGEAIWRLLTVSLCPPPHLFRHPCQWLALSFPPSVRVILSVAATSSDVHQARAMALTGIRPGCVCGCVFRYGAPMMS